MMRILQICSHLEIGGVATHVVGLAQALKRRGHAVAVAAGAGELAARLGQAGIEHWPVPLATSAEFSPAVWRATRALAQRLRACPVDILHAHTRVAQVAAESLRRRRGVPYVTTWHGYFRRRLGRRLWPCLGACTIAISEPVAQHLRRDFALPDSRIRVVPHGVDLSRIAEAADEAAQARWRARWQLPPGARVIGTMSRLVASKGVDQLLNAFAGLRALEPAAHLVIVGDGEERPKLERLAASLRIAPAVRFAGSVVDTAAALAAMDVFVFLPAVQEGFGLSLLEAMASARPIVALRRGGGAPWVLEQIGSAVVVEPDRTDLLGAAIVGLLRDPSRASELGRRSAALVRERYDLEREVEAIESVYSECVRQPMGAA